MLQLNKNSYDDTSNVYRGTVSCTIKHTCETIKSIAKAIIYDEQLRKYIEKNDYHTLKSNIGYLYDEVSTLRDFKMRVFDHECSNDGNTTDVLVSASRFSCKFRKILVARVRRDNCNCNLASRNGENSEVFTHVRFLYKPNDNIPKLHEKCPNPF